MYFYFFFSLSNNYSSKISRCHHDNLNLLTNTKKTTKQKRKENIIGFAFFINNVTMFQHYCFLLVVICLNLFSGAREFVFFFSTLDGLQTALLQPPRLRIVKIRQETRMNSDDENGDDDENEDERSSASI